MLYSRCWMLPISSYSLKLNGFKTNGFTWKKNWSFLQKILISKHWFYTGNELVKKMWMIFFKAFVNLNMNGHLTLVFICMTGKSWRSQCAPCIVTLCWQTKEDLFINTTKHYIHVHVPIWIMFSWKRLICITCILLYGPLPVKIISF